MEITQKHQNLIKNIVKSNHRFSGNEDLVEDFCSETIKRSYKLLTTINEVQKIESYLNKVATSAILGVLKDAGRLRRATQGYTQTKEIPVSSVKITAKEDCYKIDDAGCIFYDIPDPAPSIEDEITQKEELLKIVHFIHELNSEEPDKDFLELFQLRYKENFKQTEIAKKMGLSQGEVSKRLIEMTKKISLKF